MIRKAMVTALAFNVITTGVEASSARDRAARTCDAEAFVREQRNERLSLSQERSKLIAEAIEIMRQRSKITDKRVTLMMKKPSLVQLILGKEFYTEPLDQQDYVIQEKLKDNALQRFIIDEQVKILDIQLSNFKIACGY